MDYGISFGTVPERHQLSSLSIYFWMGRNVMSQFSIKVIISDTLDIKLFLGFINLDVERIISL